MFVVLLKFSDNRAAAGQFMAGHKAWLDRGFADGAFLMAGSLQPALGGAILAEGGSRSALDARLAEDPFVAEGIVAAEVMEVSPSRTDPRLAFLTGS